MGNANCLKRESVEKNKPELKFKVGDKVMLNLYPCVVTDVNWRDSLHGFVYTVRGTDFGKMVGEEDLILNERTVPNTNEIIQLIKNDWNNFKDRYDIPDDYCFVDKNGNEINISEIVLEKKKKSYPKTYEECCELIEDYVTIGDFLGYKHDLFTNFQKLILCRDAYWKIAGEEMGLDKPWEPDWDNDDWPDMYTIYWDGKYLTTDDGYPCCNIILIFPTAEMRDAFNENFKEEIEKCKELL